MGRTYSCWMLNCWCITWPVGFKRLTVLYSTAQKSFPIASVYVYPQTVHIAVLLLMYLFCPPFLLTILKWLLKNQIRNLQQQHFSSSVMLNVSRVTNLFIIIHKTNNELCMKTINLPLNILKKYYANRHYEHCNQQPSNREVPSPQITRNFDWMWFSPPSAEKSETNLK